MLAALIQLFADAMQAFNFADRTALNAAEASLLAQAEPEAIPYINFV